MKWLADFWQLLFPAAVDEGGPQPLIQRSDEWPAARKWHLRAEPDCQVCRTRRDVEVHHVVPVHLDKALELSPTNLLTLCRPHHLLFGHLGAWASWNADVRRDVEEWREKIEERPFADKEDEQG